MSLGAAPSLAPVEVRLVWRGLWQTAGAVIMAALARVRGRQRRLSALRQLAKARPRVGNKWVARTSTEDQKAGLEAQLRDLKAAGVEEANIFWEELSSVDAERPKLQEAICFMRKGDTFVVAKLDRLARSVSNYAAIEKELAEKGVALRVLNLGVDTSTPTGRLIHNTLVGIAQFEREMMLERQREGILKAKREGRCSAGSRPRRRRPRKSKRWRLKALVLSRLRSGWTSIACPCGAS